MHSPLVSIVVPSKNQGRFLRETIESCLSQDYRPIEVLVIDGASTDETLEVLHRYDRVPEVRWISEPDGGVGEAVNKGVAGAKGEIGASQSSDDYYLPGAISRGVEALQADPALGFVFGDVMKVDARGRRLSAETLAPFSIENVMALRTWIPQPSCFFRLALARGLGGWRGEVPYAADTDLWFRMMLKAGALKIDACLAARRVHGAQRDGRGADIIRDYTRAVNDWFDRFGAPERYRNAAEAGVLLQRNHYGAGEPESVKRDRHARALRLFPPLRPPRRGAIGLALAAWRRCLRRPQAGQDADGNARGMSRNDSGLKRADELRNTDDDRRS